MAQLHVRANGSVGMGGAAAGVVLLVTSSAWGGNDDEVLIGTDAALTAGAVTATVHDGSALWYNPAGLGAMGKQQVDATATAYTLRLWGIPEYLTAPTGKTVGGGTYEAVTVPSAITYVRELNEKWSLGFGYFLSRWSDIRGHALLQFPDEGQTASWQSGYVQTYSLHNFALGASYEASSSLRWGADVIGFYNGSTFANEFSGGIEGGANSSFITGTLQGTQSHSGLQLQAGVQWKPSKKVDIGLSVRTPGVGFFGLYSSEGYYSGAVSPDGLSGGSSEFEDAATYQTFAHELTRWAPVWVLPARVRLGLAQQLGDSWWSLDVDYQSGLKSEPVTVGSESFQAVDRAPVFNARLGGKRVVNETFAYGVGVFTDLGSTRNVDLGEGRFDFFGFAGGIELGNIHRLDRSERADRLSFSTSLGVRYAYGVGKVGTLEVPYFNEFLQETAEGESPVTLRTTTASAHEITINLGGGLFF